jgi:hypothetical protein
MKRERFCELLDLMADRIEAEKEQAQPTKFDDYVEVVLDRVETVLADPFGDDFCSPAKISFKFSKNSEPQEYVDHFMTLWFSHPISDTIGLDIGSDGLMVAVHPHPLEDLDGEEVEHDDEVADHSDMN